MSKITINGDISGDNNKFGDVYNYNNAKTFIADHSNLSGDLQEIVDLIFQHENSDKLKKEMLTDLKKIAEGEGEDIQKSSAKYWEKFVQKLEDKGLEKSAQFVVNNIGNAIPAIAPYFEEVFEKLS